MKLIRVHIHNYRAILDTELTLRDYSLLVAPNNSGKTTVIDAIRAFYEKDGFKFDMSRDFPHVTTQDQESWIELTYQLTDNEHASLADIYKNGSQNQLRVRKYFRTDKKMADGKPAQGFIFGYRPDVGDWSGEPFYGAKNVQSGNFGDVIYIPAISKVDDHTKLTGPSALRDLLNDIMSEVVESGKAYKDFTSAVERFSGEVRADKTSDGRSLAGFEDALNKLISAWQVKFGLVLPPPSAAELTKSMVKWKITDGAHGKEQDIDVYGSGFQRYFIYCLIQLGSQYVGKKPAQKTKDFTPSFNLVLFEEPEAFLHPPQQDELARNLRELSSREVWQALCATHSSHFVSRNADDIPAIVRLRRCGSGIQAFQVTKEAWGEMVSQNQKINQIAQDWPKMKKKLESEDGKAEMEAVKYFLWLNPDRSSAFFADHVLLTEGETEVALINRLIADGKVEGVPPGLYVLDCLGKWNIHRFMNLFSHLGVIHSVLYDDDGNSEEHAQINQLIEDSKDKQFTHRVTAIQGKIETMLGLSNSGAPYRKPQHALYAYENGRISDKELAKLVDLLRQLFSKK
jgi:putative ATP-dependent endonuclease of OLD family